MNAITLSRHGHSAASPPVRSDGGYEDPLNEDQITDARVTTSHRGLTRLALVAAETGARFQREAVDHDAMAWMLAPRSLFDGASAIEACLEREHCLRSIVLHGLSIGLDAHPATIDALLADGPVDDEAGDPWAGGDRDRLPNGRPGGRRLKLYSASIVIARGGELLHAFHASVAPSAAVVRERIRARLGSAAAAQADIRIGFDPECPLTAGMVPPAIMDTLVRVGRRTRWAAMAGLDVTVEQRLPS